MLNSDSSFVKAVEAPTSNFTKNLNTVSGPALE